MTLRISPKKYFLLVATAISVFLLASNVLAESCPSKTTVEGTTVTFVGEVTDVGGDPGVTVWFEYGKTEPYNLKTQEKALTTEGERYCIVVSSLEPCTTYHYRAAAKNSAGIGYGEYKTFTTSCTGLKVDIKANNSDGPISIQPNTSANLTWTSQSVNSCTAAGAWSGTKLTSGSESTGNLTSSKTYTITCFGLGGSASDSVAINVQQVLGEVSPTIQKKARNLSDGQSYYSDSVIADPDEVLEFLIQINSGSEAQSVTVKDILPAQITVRVNSLKVDGVAASGDITSGISLSNLAASQTKTITFWADVAGVDKFNFGNTDLMNTATVYWNGDSVSDSTAIVVTKKGVLGVATSVSTGLTNNVLVDSFFLPLVFASILTWLLKSHVLKWEEWLDERKKEYRKFRTEKLLRLKIAQIKTQEFFGKKVF